MDGAIAEWHDFFLGAAGAGAALAGLLFVAISINVREIVAEPSLPPRAAETIAFAIAPMVVSLLALMPDQSVRAIGAEALGVGLATWLLTSVAESRRWRLTAAEVRGQRGVWSLVLGQLAALGPVVGAVLLLAGNADGLYVLGAGIALSFTVAVLNGWVLLIEVLR